MRAKSTLPLLQIFSAARLKEASGELHDAMDAWVDAAAAAGNPVPPPSTVKSTNGEKV